MMGERPLIRALEMLGLGAAGFLVGLAVAVQAGGPLWYAVVGAVGLPLMVVLGRDELIPEKRHEDDAADRPLPREPLSGAR